MARKSYEGTGVLPGFEEDSRPSSKKASVNSARTPRFSTPRLIVTFVTALVVLGGILYGFHLAEQFLITDSRFALGADDSSLQIIGAAHASRPAIEKIFADDEGVSVYLIPLAARRDALSEVAWIREASVARV